MASTESQNELSNDAALPQETRGDVVYALIMERIIEGEFKPGLRLPSETSLAERFGVSRPIVREALARLRDHGLVFSRRGSGSYVHHGPHKALLRFAPVDNIGGIQRCLEFRLCIESRAAGLAAERHDARSLADIDRTIRELERVIQFGEVGVEADFAFHLAIASAARNDYFRQTIEMLAEQVRVGMKVMRNLSLLRTAARLRTVQEEHVAIMDAIRQREVERATHAMTIHIENARQRMLAG